MMKIIDQFSGSRKFFNGTGRKGNCKIDDFQKLLLEGERTNGFEYEPKQKPLSKKELRAYMGRKTRID